jgi:hypothetical protein
MPSGGHGNSGPAPDPNALRRDRKDDAAWQVLPVEGFSGVVPDLPLGEVSEAELALWSELWCKPQAFMWDRLGLKYEVAAYVRAFLESVESGASAGLKTAVLRMGAEIGLSLPGMHSLRWKFGEDELAKKRQSSAVAADEDLGSDAEERWAALANGR